MNEPSIRAARSADYETLRHIEVLAGQGFADIGMPTIAAHEPSSLETFAEASADDALWVAEVAAELGAEADAEADAEVVGYAMAGLVDAVAHLHQVSVRPDAQRRGIGRALVDEVTRWAAARGCAAVTLTTFREVPWNGPWYVRLGFAELDEAELGPELRAIRQAEIARGVDVAPRIAMRRPVTRPPE